MTMQKSGSGDFHIQFPFNLQLFAGEGGDGGDGGDDGSGAGNAEDASTDQGSAGDGGAAGGQGNNNVYAGNTLLGGKQGNDAAGKTGADAQTGPPESYDFKSIVPEGLAYDEASAQAFSGIAKECGLNQEQASKIAAYGMQYMQQGAQGALDSINQTIAGWGEQAKQELGSGFQETVSKAGAGIEALEKTIPNLRTVLNETGAGNRIEIIRAMAMVGELTKEDGNRTNGAGSGADANIYTNTDFSKYK